MGKWWGKYKSQCRSVARNISAAQSGRIPPSLYRFVPDAGKFRGQIRKAFGLINDPPLVRVQGPREWVVRIEFPISDAEDDEAS